jgi:CDP-diacylglycerol--glycerol-3-phosphate 3-phosphatidyltransferase
MSFIEDKARDVSRPLLEAVGRVLARLGFSPDLVTFLGLVLTVGVAALAAWGEIFWAGIVYIFAAVCDALDGTLARISGGGSRFGAFFDSTIDRFEESMVFLGLSIYYAKVGGQWEIPLILVAAIGSLMVSYTRSRAEAVGVSCKVGFMTRPPRVVIMIIGMIVNQVFIALIVIAVLSLFTAFHRMYHVWKMTGGGRSGWDLPKEVFIMPGPPIHVAQEAEEAQEPESPGEDE